MSGEQSSIQQYINPDDTAGGIRDALSGIVGRIRNRLEDAGLSLDWWGERPSDVDTDDDIWVYQFVEAYSKGSLVDGYDFSESGSARAGSPSPEVQFKLGIYVIGEPTDEIERRIRDIDIGRLITCFDTGAYGGYMSGFGFEERKTYTQRERVSIREVVDKNARLGMPWWEVEAYDEDGSLEGYADGSANPFTTETRTETIEDGQQTPENEIWRVQTDLYESRSAGGQWEVGPDEGTPARARAKEVAGKDVYIGPFRIGKLTQRGTTWFRREYDSGGKYADKATITSESGIPPQALQKGVKLYKYNETEDGIYLSTTEPQRSFNPTSPEDIREDQTGRTVRSREVTEVLLDDDEPTQFTVETDETTGRLMGLYNPIVVRDIERQTRLV